MRRSPVPPSPPFEAAARGAQFRDRIAVVVKAAPEAVFQAFEDVTLRDLKFARLLGDLRYLPSLAIEPERTLTLGWLTPDGTPEVTWTFVLDAIAHGVTRRPVRVRGGPGYRFHRLPLVLTRRLIRVVHFIMQGKQLLGIASRAEGCAAAHSIDTAIPPQRRQDAATERRAS
jgi:hypothetical protein